MAELSAKISCICNSCGKTTQEAVNIELNFSEKCIYWFCVECKTMNKIDFNALKDLVPLPKMRLM